MLPRLYVNHPLYLQVSQGMVGQGKARRAAGIILEMVKVSHELVMKYTVCVDRIPIAHVRVLHVSPTTITLI